jgi:DNA-directed RNA polymerase specialized sigma subunit
MIDYEIELDLIEQMSLEETENQEEDIVLRECAQSCLVEEKSCDCSDCKHWIRFKDDNNCDLISIQKHGALTLRQVGERIGVSYVRVKQIEDVAIKKIRQTVPLDKIIN